MFSRCSRYKNLPDVVTTDSQGRATKSRDLRQLPEVSGDFLHAVEEIDRLDHLAHTYYGRPTKWWRICDANPDFMSPLALLGKTPIVTTRFPLIWDDENRQPPWTEARRRLVETVGVLDVQIIEKVQPVPEVQVNDGQQVTVYVDQYERAMVVTHNRMNVSAKELSDLITKQPADSDEEEENFEVGEPENIGRIGKRIVIPPDVPG